MLLGEIFPKDTIVVNLESTEKDELFEELVEKIHSYCPELDRNEALKDLNEREEKMTTGIMHSVAIPHAQVSSIKTTIGAIGISKDGIDYNSLDKAPVYVVFMILGPQNEAERHIQILKSLAQVLQIPGFVDKITKCNTSGEAYKLLCDSEESLIQ